MLLPLSLTLIWHVLSFKCEQYWSRVLVTLHTVTWAMEHVGHPVWSCVLSCFLTRQDTMRNHAPPSMKQVLVFDDQVTFFFFGNSIKLPNCTYLKFSTCEEDRRLKQETKVLNVMELSIALVATMVKTSSDNSFGEHLNSANIIIYITILRIFRQTWWNI